MWLYSVLIRARLPMLDVLNSGRIQLCFIKLPALVSLNSRLSNLRARLRLRRAI